MALRSSGKRAAPSIHAGALFPRQARSFKASRVVDESRASLPTMRSAMLSVKFLARMPGKFQSQRR